MIPIVETLRQAGRGAWRFARARWRLTAIAVVIYVGSALLAPRLLAPPEAGVIMQSFRSWLITLPSTFLLAPIWVALDRAVILREGDRRFLTFDARLWRMSLVLAALSLVGLVGGMPSVFSIALAVRIPAQRLVVLSVMAGGFLVRLLMWWLSLRLAIAPPMAATGTRANALDTSFSYTPGEAVRIGLVKVLVYLPLTAITGGLVLLEKFDFGLSRLVSLSLVTPVVMALITAATDIVDAAAVAVIAMTLVRGRQAATKAAAAAATA